MADKWRVNGNFYGYPKFCIDWFCSRLETDNSILEEQNMVHKNTGFIPCINCSQKILRGEETLNTLIKNRKCKTSFPFVKTAKNIFTK